MAATQQQRLVSQDPKEQKASRTGGQDHLCCKMDKELKDEKPRFILAGGVSADKSRNPNAMHSTKCR